MTPNSLCLSRLSLCARPIPKRSLGQPPSLAAESIRCSQASGSPPASLDERDRLQAIRNLTRQIAVIFMGGEGSSTLFLDFGRRKDARSAPQAEVLLSPGSGCRERRSLPAGGTGGVLLVPFLKGVGAQRRESAAQQSWRPSLETDSTSIEVSPSESTEQRTSGIAVRCPVHPAADGARAVGFGFTTTPHSQRHAGRRTRPVFHSYISYRSFTH